MSAAIRQTPIFKSVAAHLDARLDREPTRRTWREHRNRILLRQPQSPAAIVDWAVDVLRAGVAYSAARFTMEVRRLEANGQFDADKARATSRALTQLAEATEVLSVAADALSDAVASLRMNARNLHKIEAPVLNAVCAVVRAFGAEKLEVPSI